MTIFSQRRLSLRLLLPLLAVLAGMPAAADITNASLEIQGIGLSVVTPEPPVTTGIDVPTTVQTKFGGKMNDEAMAIEGLLAVGDLTGPGLDAPLELSTAPGHKFEIPGLSREGVYTLQNIRLMKGRELLQYATPSAATIIVADLFKTTVEVRQLSPEEIRARGIVIDSRNFEVYEYTLSFIIRGETVKIPFPVIIDPRTRQVQQMPIIDPYSLPPISTIGVGRFTPPDIITVAFEDDKLPEEEGNTPKEAKEPGEKLYVRPPIPAAIVIPNSLAVMHQFFAVILTVQNGAPNGSTARLDNLTARIKVPSQLRTATSKPAVSLGQAVPIVDKVNGLTILVAQAKGEAEWSVEALKPGTHTIEIELKGTLKENGQEDVPLVARPRASVVVHDARFNIAFSHPDVVRQGIEYTTYSFVTNTSPSTQTIQLANSVPPCETAGNANVCRLGGGLSDELTLLSGETKTVEYRLRSGITGKVFATAASIDSEHAVATAQLHMGVSDSGIPLSPATLIMPHYAQYVDESLVSQYLRILGLGYSLATAPVTSATAKLPRVIKSDIHRRAVDIAQAGQAIFLANDAPGSKRDALMGLSIDLLGNTAELSQWDQLRRQEKYARPAGAAVVRQLEAAGLTNGTTFESFIDSYGKALSHRDGYVAALVHGPEVAGNARPYALSVRGASSGRRMDVPNEAASGWVRDLPYGELSTISAPTLGRAGELALVGRWTNEDLEVIVTPSVNGPFRLELLYPNTTDGSTMRAHFELTGVAGEPLRVPLSRGAATIHAVLPNGGFADTATSSVVALETLRVVGMRQDLYLDENGHKVSVLFNRPVAASAPDTVPAVDLRTKFHGEIDFNKDGVVWMDEPRPISAAALQESKRVIDLTFDHVLTTNAAYTIEVDALHDPRLNAPATFLGEFVPKIDNDRPAGIIYGRFVRGDNTPLGNHEVILFSGRVNPETRGAIFEEFENPRRRIPVNPFIQPPQIVNTRADGSYLFEFVPRDLEADFSGAFRLWGLADGLTKYTYVDGAVRLPGRVHHVTLQLLGRGSAEGTVRYDNGELAKNANVTVGSTAFEGVRSAVTNAQGFYRVEDLPVGPLAFTATDAAGNIGYAAGEIATPGEIEQQDISIYRQPVPKNGSVQGVVRRSDTGQPVSGATVGLFNNGYPLFVLTTDPDGRYNAEKVPAGFISVVAAEWSLSRQSAATDFDLRGDEVRQVDLTLSVIPNEQLTTVTGEVLREDPLFPGNASKYQKVAGALVKIDGMRIVTAGADGKFEFVDVPLTKTGAGIAAYDPATRRTERAVVPQLTVAGPNNVPILLRGLGKGTIRARLFDARGDAAAGVEMLVKLGGAYFAMDDLGGGLYELDKLDVGQDYIVRTGAVPSTYGEQEVISGPVRVAFDGQTASVSLRLPGQGAVHARVKGISIPADGGEPILTPLISEVTLRYGFFNASTLTSDIKEVTLSTNQNGLPGDAIFTAVPALRQYEVVSNHPLGQSSAGGRLAFEGDLGDHTLLLSNLGRITGTVYAIDGVTPVPNAQVRLEDGHQDQGIVNTGLDGKFEFRNVAPNTGFRVWAQSTQAGIFRTGERYGSIASNGGIVNVSITMLERGQIEGKIVYGAYKVYDPLHPENNVLDNTPNDPSDNAPVPLARFWMKELDFPRRDMGTPTQPLSADLAGRFAIDNVFVGRLRATSWSVDNPDLRGDWTATLTREGELLTPYILIGGGGGTGTIVATVTNPNQQNAPVENAEVQLFRGGLFDLASTGVDGKVRFEQLPVGTYVVGAYSKALGKSGRAADAIVLSTDQVAEARIMLTFSGQVTGRLTDPEAIPPNSPVPGSHVTISMAEGFQQRFTTTALGEYLFEGVREGLFSLDAKDTASNRRARATGLLSAADPAPVVNLELERTETLHLGVYLPDDFGANSGVLAGPVEATVTQRNGEFYRAMQGNPIVMPALFLNENYRVDIQEVGGERRLLTTTGRFPAGNASQPIKLHYPAYGSAEVLVRRAGAAVEDARVSLRVSRYDTRVVYADAAGRVLFSGLPLNGTYSVTVTTLDGSSGSASVQVLRTSVLATVTIEVGARATLTGKVLAEAGGPSIGTPVVINFSGGQLSGTTDDQGSFTFAGVATTPSAAAVELLYYGPDGSTLGARQSFPLGNQWAGRDDYPVPTVRLDATPPVLLDIVPAQGAGNVPPDTHLKFVFSEAIDPATINNDTFTLQPADGTPRVNAGFTSSAGANGTYIVTMVPPAAPAGQAFPLKSNTLYRLTVSQHVRDLTGHPVGTNRGLTFTTADYVEPRVVSMVPAAGEPVPEQITYEFRFNEPLDPAPFNPGGNGVFQLSRMSGPEENATVEENIAGNAYVDPFTGISLFFAPSQNTKPNSFYRIKFSGVRDLQGNIVPEQTYRLISFDTFKPFVILNSPVPEGATLISGLTYKLLPDIRNATADGTPAIDIASVEYFRVENEVETFIKAVKKAPFAYDFVAPEAPAAGAPLVFRARAIDLSTNESDKVTLALTVKPNQPPTVAVALDRTTNVYAGETVNATVTTADEVLDINLQLDVKATRTDGTEYRVVYPRTVHRNSIADPWPATSIAVPLPLNLLGGSTMTFTGIATDMSGLSASSTTPLTLAADTAKPVIVSTTPAAWTELTFGSTYKLSATVTDVGTGVSQVVFTVDGQTFTVPRSASVNGVFTSPSIAVTANSVNTTMPVTVTAADYAGNSETQNFNVVYLAVNDPTVPTGEWLCPISDAVLPANTNNLPVKLRLRAKDDVSVTSVRFQLPGVETLVTPTEELPGEYAATVTLNTPGPATTDFVITAIVKDANPAHTQEYRLRLSFVTPDFTIDSTQAIIAADVATYEDKSIVVRGTQGRLVPHVPVRLKNLIVLEGAHVDTLATTTSTERRLDLTITGNLYVDCASSIDVTARGYLGAYGANSDGSGTRNESEFGRTDGNTIDGGAKSSGGSHGGLGDIRDHGSTNAAFGSVTEPRTLGAGGGGTSGGGAGGGAVALTGSENARFIIAGAIRADGGAGRLFPNGGGGAGGSVLLRAQDIVLGSSARVTANGGDIVPGGGGRIAVYATRTLTMPDNTVQARGGWNTGPEAVTSLDGGAGTIYLVRPEQNDAEGELLVSAFHPDHPATIHQTNGTPLGTEGGSELVFRSITAGPRALLRFDSPYRATQQDGIAVHATAMLLGPADQPVLSFTTTPAAGSTVWQNAPVTVNYNGAALDGIGEVRFILPGGTDKIDDFNTFPATIAPRNTNLTIPANAAVGPITLTVRARSRSGRVLESATSFTVVSDAAPQVQFDSVTPGTEIYAGGTISVTATATDDIEVKTLDLASSVSGVTPQPATKPTPQSMARQFSVAVPKTTPGGTGVVLTLSASDGFPSRPATTATHTVTVLHDTVAPVVAVIRPTASQEINEAANGTFTIEVSAVDAEVGVNTVKATFEGTQYTLQPVSGQPGRYLVNGVPIPSVDGAVPVPKPLSIAVTDFEPNTTPISQTVYIVPLADPNAPKMSWICNSPGAMYPAGYAVPLRVSAIGSSGQNGVQRVEVSINGAAPIAAPSVGTNLYQATYTIPAGTAAGTVFDVRVSAFSTSGNEAALLSTITVAGGTEIIGTTDIPAADLSFDNTSIIVRSGGVLTVTGPHTFTNLTVLEGGKLVQKHVDLARGDKLSVQRLFVACNGSIDVSALGYTSNSTYPGAANADDAGGGSHIGRGGIWNRLSGGVFGSVYEPLLPGGGGNMPDSGLSTGGGVVRIASSSGITIDGAVRANGVKRDWSGGAGGSIWLSTPGALHGGGTIEANGSTAVNGPGGGGAVLLDYASTSGAIATNAFARGATANTAGRHSAAGTVLRRAGGALDLTIDNGTISTFSATELPSFGRAGVKSVSPGTIVLGDRRFVSTSLVGNRVRATAADGTVRGTYRIAGVTNPAASFTLPFFAEIRTQDAVAYDGYLMYSTNGLGVEQRKLAAVRKNGSQWQYDNDTAFVAFTPSATDYVFGSFSKSASAFTSLTTYRCADTCGSVDGLPVMEVVYGEVLSDNSSWTLASGPQSGLSTFDAHEIYIHGDDMRRAFTLSAGNASLKLESLDGSALNIQAGDTLRGLYSFDSVKLTSARVITEDLVETVTPLEKDAASSLITGNLDAPVVQPSLISFTKGTNGPVLVGQAGAVSDPDKPIKLLVRNTSRPVPPAPAWSGSGVSFGTVGGYSARKIDSGVDWTGITQTVATSTTYSSISMRPSQTNKHMGLEIETPDTGNTMALFANGVWQVWRNSVGLSISGSYTTNTVFKMERTPTSVRWLVDGQQVHQVAVDATPHFGRITFRHDGGEMSSLEYTNEAPSRFTVTAAADGSFSVPVAGAPGDAFAVTATDSHFYPLSGAEVAVGSVPGDIGLASVAVAPNPVTGGRIAVGTVTMLSAAPAGGAVVELRSSSTLATVPATVTVPAGMTSANFNITTTPVPTPSDVTLTAWYGTAPKSTLFTIVKDTTNPAVTITTPVAGAQFNEGATAGVALETTIIEEDSGIATVTATFGGVTTNLTRNVAKGPNVWTATLPIPFIEETTPVSKDIVVTATDNNANIGTATVSVTVKPISDVNPPALAWTCFSSGGMYPVGDVVTLKVTATPPNGTNVIQTVQFFVTDPGGTTTSYAATALPNNEYQFLYTVPAVTDGAAFQVRALATTVAGTTQELTRTFTAVADAVKITATTTIAANTTTYDGKSVVITGGTTTVTGPHTFKRLIVYSGATVVHVAGGSLDVQTTDGVFVACNGSIDASSKGYPTNTTYPGATVGSNAAAGSHMGYGGVDSTPFFSTYGSVYRPAEGGSGGSRTGSGGGIVRITASSVTNDGTIRANGQTVNDETGAGGSVWITTATLGGTGTIEARGGNSFRGSGGGAVAIEYGTASGTVLANTSAAGGTGTKPGGAGTVYLKSTTSVYGSLIINNGTVTGRTTDLPALGKGTAQPGSSGTTLVTDRATNVPVYFVGHWVRIRSAAGVTKGTWRVGATSAKSVTLVPNGAETIDVQSGDLWQGLYRFDEVTLRNAVLVSADPIETAEQTIDGPIVTSSIETTNLVVKSGGSLTHPAGQSLSIVASGEVRIEAGGSIDASSMGFTVNTTYPGATIGSNAAAGSHMGNGGVDSAPFFSTYGSVYRPAEAGSGGSRTGSGGGIVRITASSVTNDGTIRANGQTVNDETGAGGSVWITTTTLAGTGTIEARGGNSFRGSGGGAVAIEYGTASGTVLANTSAAGGTGTKPGGAGTVYLKPAASVYGNLIINNGTVTGATTDLPALGKGTAQPGSSGTTLVTDRTTNVPVYFVGHWVRIRSAAGTTKGTWRVGATSAKSVTLVPNGAETINVQASDQWQGLYRFDQVTLRNAVVVSADPIETTEQTIDGSIVTSNIETTNLLVKAGASLTHPNIAGAALSIVASGEVRIEAGASIDASSRGYTVNTTYPGATLGSFAAAGSHLGYGGVDSAPFFSTYGSLYRPAEAGSGGSRTGSGGGIVRIAASSLTNDGTIRANGQTVNDETGGGGSVWITTATLAGTGTVEAKGGNSFRGSGGGAVSIEYGTASGTVLANTSASGGTGAKPGGAGTVYLKPASSVYGNLIIDNKNVSGQSTALPSFGSGEALNGSGGATLVTNRTINIPAYFAGHWVEISSVGGTLKGTWRIGSISGKTATLVPNAGETIDVQAGDAYQGVYRFDNVTLRTTKVISGDPLRSTFAPDQGATIVDINDGPPSFPAAKRSQIVVESAITGDAVTGPAGAVIDPSTPIKLTVTNTRTAATYPVVNANADGSFRVPVVGQGGDTFTIYATDSHTVPLNSAPIAVNGSIVELNTIASLTIVPSTVVGSTTTYGSLRLSLPARAAGAAVSLSSSASGVASVPATFVVPAGAVSAQFPITTSSPVTATDAVITAALGSSVASATLTVTPATSALVDLVLESSAVEGGTTVNGTVVLGAPAPPGGALVMLTSTAPQAGVPATVLIAEGEMQAAFTVTTARVAATTRAAISATWGSSVAKNLDLTACSAMAVATPPASASMNTVWLDEAPPAGAAASGDASFDSTQAATGTMALHFAPPSASSIRAWTFTNGAPLTVAPGDRLVFYTLVNPCNPPRQMLVQWNDAATPATPYRASWGENRIGDKSTVMLNAGSVPAGGEWRRMEIVAKTMGIAATTNLTGLTVSVDGGEAWIDAIGVASCSITKQAKPAYLQNERVWFDDALPAGAAPFTSYNWDTSQVASGNAADLVGTTATTAMAQHVFTGATDALTLKAEDMIVTYVLIDPCNPPRELMLEWNDGSSWNRRAYWGENLYNVGAHYTVERRRMGAIPETGKWVRLEIPASSMGMTGMTIRGMAFTLYGGRAWFDRVATVSRVNLALNKNASQSSGLADPCELYNCPSKAVDGELTVGYQHTDLQLAPWWQVDLGAVQPIASIDLWNGGLNLCCQDRLQNFWVFVSDVPFSSNTVAGTLAQPGVTAYYYLRQAARPTAFDIHRSGRFVRVQLAGTNYLHIAEVQVWAPVSPVPVNLAVGRSASQSSTYQNAYTAAMAINGNSVGETESHTNSELEAWWQVDLGSVQPISSVDIDNVYGGGESSRMSNFYLFISDSPFTSTTVAGSLAQSGVSAFYRIGPLSGYTFDPGRRGRFIRIQLTGTNYLHPMEVRVWSPSLSIGALAKSPEKF